MTALMHAAQHGHADIVKLLLEKEQNMLDKDGHNARWHAIGWCKEMLAKVEECMDCTSLLEAAEKGCESCCRRLVWQADDAKDVVDADGHGASESSSQQSFAAYRHNVPRYYTALMVAAQHGYARCVRILAEKEAGMQDELGETALILAAIKGHLECVEILAPLEKGMKMSEEWTALMYAAKGGKTDCVRHLAPHEAGMTTGSRETALMKAAAQGHLDCVKVLAPLEAKL